MNLITCIDDRAGVAFNGKRQSRDKVLFRRLLRLYADKNLWMNATSASIFPGDPRILIDEDFLSHAGENDYCFVEKVSLAAFEKKIRTLILCRWNRVYPADTFLDLDLSDPTWKHEELCRFKGNSHDMITIEVWQK